MYNLMWKDCKVSMKVIGVLFVLVGAVGFLPSLLLSHEYLSTVQETSVIRSYMMNIIIFFPAMQIPMLGTLIIQSTINEERKQHILPVLLANGVLPEKIWLSKLFVSMIASYMFCLVSVIGGILYTKTVYNIWITINLYFGINVLFLVPVAAFGFLCIIGIIMWTSKKGQFIAGFIPMVSYLVCMYLNLYLAKMKIEMNWILLLLIGTSLAGGVFIVCFYIAKKINKEYIVNIDV